MDKIEVITDINPGRLAGKHKVEDYSLFITPSDLIRGNMEIPREFFNSSGHRIPEFYDEELKQFYRYNVTTVTDELADKIGVLLNHYESELIEFIAISSNNLDTISRYGEIADIKIGDELTKEDFMDPIMLVSLIDEFKQG